mgnify:FL=1
MPPVVSVVLLARRSLVADPAGPKVPQSENVKDSPHGQSRDHCIA